MANRKNKYGEPMISGYSTEARKTLRVIRSDVRKAGFLMGSFQAVYGLETDLGPEWVAAVRHVQDAFVIVHRAYGLDALTEAKRRARICVDGPGAFAVRRIDGDLTSATRERGSDGPPIDRKPAPTPAPPPPTRRQP